MNIFRLLFELFLLYLAYKFIFGFVIPVYKTTKQMKHKMAEMKERMDQQQSQAAQNTTATTTKTEKATVGGDYIDYEEVK